MLTVVVACCDTFVLHIADANPVSKKSMPGKAIKEKKKPRKASKEKDKPGKASNKKKPGKASKKNISEKKKGE